MQKGEPQTKVRKLPFQMHECAIFGEIISRHGAKPDSQKLHMLTEMPPLNTKKEFQSFLDILEYLDKISSVTAEVY